MTSPAPAAAPGTAAAGSAPGPLRANPALASLALLLLAIVFVNSAWLCDDAYITFRTVENLVSGLGPRWNPAERVQTFTHPLWMIAVALARALTGEVYYTALALSLALALLAAGIVLFRLARGTGPVLAAAALLVSSKAFVDYAASGLENPLLYVLLALLVLAVGRDGARRGDGHENGRGRRDVLRAALLASLLAVTRPDSLLLALPLLGLVLVRARRAGTAALSAAGSLAAGFLPLVAWEAFSVVYYGFPFPNTAYAKLGSSIGSGDLARQGLAYLASSLRLDPLTPVTLGAAIVALAASGSGRARAAAIGCALYVLYVVHIGGDFMSGRFLAAPFLLAVAAAAGEPRLLAGFRGSAVAALALACGLLLPLAPLRSGRDYGFGHPISTLIDVDGIADERAHYYFGSGLLRARENGGLDHPWKAMGLDARARAGRSGSLVVIEPGCGMGYYGYHAGPLVHVVDVMAITDPLLARIRKIEIDHELPLIFPSMKGRTWRIGHLRRKVPDGYRETLETGRNVIADVALARLWDDVALVTRAPLLARERWAAILRLNGVVARRASTDG